MEIISNKEVVCQNGIDPTQDRINDIVRKLKDSGSPCWGTEDFKSYETQNKMLMLNNPT